MPERYTSADHYWDDFSRVRRVRVQSRSEDDDETQPLPEVSIYRGFLGKIDFVKIGLANCDFNSVIFWEYFDQEVFSGVLEEDVQDFLRLNGKNRINGDLMFVVDTQAIKGADLSLENQERRVVFDFDDEQSFIKAIFQVKETGNWVGVQEAERDVRPEVNRLLDLAVKLTDFR